MNWMVAFACSSLATEVSEAKRMWVPGQPGPFGEILLPFTKYSSMTDHLPEYAQSLGSTPCTFKKKLNQNKIIVIKRTLKWQDVSQDEQPTARPDDLRLILGTCLGKGENCFLQVVLWSLHDCYGTCMWCAHMCSNAVMAISLLLVHTGSARCLCYHELSPFTMLSLSLWAEVPWNADKIVFL